MKLLRSLLLLLLFASLALAAPAQEEAPPAQEETLVVELIAPDGVKQQTPITDHLDVYRQLISFLGSEKDGTFHVLRNAEIDLDVVVKDGQATVTEHEQTGTMTVAEARALVEKSLSEEMAAMCYGNLFHSGEALEAYAKDHSGAYPDDLGQLVPKYLEAVPTCPVSATGSYSASYQHGAEPAWCQVQCFGDHSAAGLNKGLPAYSSEHGPLSGDGDLGQLRPPAEK